MEGIDTVTISTPGSEPVTMTGQEFEELPGRILRNMQLSFDVGGQRPQGIKLAIGGKIGVDRQLLKGERVMVNVCDENGEIICHAPGTVTAIAFVDKTKEGFTETTREQKITLDT